LNLPSRYSFLSAFIYELFIDQVWQTRSGRRAGYTVYAEFANAGGIKSGSVVEIAGVEIGKVKSVRLDNYSALASLWIHKGVKLQDDAIASIKTKGLIGEKYIQVAPGGSDVYLTDGGKIRETESALDIEELVSKYVFGKV